uniref:Uncharacterized protein n=2 Tax=Oryza TaxID=4527 RepID=A0A0E0MT74_ORYRU
MSKSDESDTQIKTRTNCKLSLFFLHFYRPFSRNIMENMSKLPSWWGYVYASLLLIHTLYVDWAFSTNQKSLGKLVNG